MKIKLLFLLLGALTFSISTFAQNATITGRALFADKSPVIGANVYVKQLKTGVVTDSKGRYEISKLKPGAYSLIVSFVGYKTVEQNVLINHNNEKVEIVVEFTEYSKELDGVTIVANSILGSKHSILGKTGSAYYVSKEELNNFGHMDINRILSSVPGVNLYEEDGYGLKPNISLRGVSPSRSSKITIMEDGILAAPAPYASPAAYYFPTVGRMEAIEILKGSSQIQYGPFTTGGAINFVSAHIPTKLRANLKMSYGTFNTSSLRGTIGNSYKYVGYVVDYAKYSSDGFKYIDNQPKKGFDKNDITVKLRLNTDLEKEMNHSITAKFQYSNENSDETYVGLSNDDYNLTPFRRYAATALDNIKSNHKQFAITYLFNINKNININLTGYYNTFHRNWYKLDKVNVGKDSPSLGKVLESPDKYKNVMDILDGKVNTPDKPLLIKANNRDYYSKGIQAKVNYRFSFGRIRNELEVGARLHTDNEDRFQNGDMYDIINSTLLLGQEGKPGSDANRVITAKTTSTYLLYKFAFKNLQITPGLRYEHISIIQDDYGKKDSERTGKDIKTTKNNIGGTLIPGVGVNYGFTRFFSAFASVHKGFSPPGAKVDTKPESSVNYELGVRVKQGALYAEAVGFYNKYSNLLGSDMAATGGSGSLDQFNAGKVNVGGMEFLLNYDFMPNNNRFSFPFSLSYTLTSTKFNNEFKSDVWGDVKEGDEIPYIAKHLLSANLGFGYDNFSITANARYNSGFRTKAGQGNISSEQKAGNSFVIDLIGKYSLNKHIDLSISAVNLFNVKYIASRSPYGIRPGMPRGIYIGLSLVY